MVSRKTRTTIMLTEESIKILEEIKKYIKKSFGFNPSRNDVILWCIHASERKK